MTNPTSQTREKTEHLVQQHYEVDHLKTRIDDALRRAGFDSRPLEVDSLAPVDAFHIRGRQSTEQLVALLDLTPKTQVLDVGCGIGGTARFLASNYGCGVTGVDLTATYCELATELSARVGLEAQTEFLQASALELPFEPNTFDVVWTEHVQMNIADKQRFYSELVRVLRPGGVLAFHDVFAGHSSHLEFPMPWSTLAESSFLAPVIGVRKILEELPLDTRSWVDCTEASKAWFGGVRQRFENGEPPPLGVHLLMGPTARDKVINAHEGLSSGAMVTIQAVLGKTGAN
jgi:MPBQ/MSBQ methyltransferase